jgi:hypothetical protein
MANTNRTISDLRETLFDTIELLKKGKISVEQAQTIGDLGQVIVNSAKEETNFIKIVADPSYRRTDGSGFLEGNVEPKKIAI